MSVRCVDCLVGLRELPDNSVDAIVTDPPYGLSFMGKKWDYDVPSVEVWAECLRVLKPGGYLLAFAGTRTQHRMAVRIEDAGFEIRDMIAWVYGSGFPKSLDVSKAIDKRGGNPGLTAHIGAAIKVARESRGLTVGECDREFCDSSTNWSWFEGRSAGQRAPTPETFAKIVAAWPELAPLADAVAEADREVIGYSQGRSSAVHGGGQSVGSADAITAPATDAARHWQGWGTALKPALEPITVARKPLGSYAWAGGRQAAFEDGHVCAVIPGPVTAKAQVCRCGAKRVWREATVAANVLEHGTGALNIDGCRVPGEPTHGSDKASRANGTMGEFRDAPSRGVPNKVYDEGRWPANLILSVPEDQYALRDDVTPAQLRQLAEWMDANA